MVDRPGCGRTVEMLSPGCADDLLKHSAKIAEESSSSRASFCADPWSPTEQSRCRACNHIHQRASLAGNERVPVFKWVTVSTDW